MERSQQVASRRNWGTPVDVTRPKLHLRTFTPPRARPGEFYSPLPGLADRYSRRVIHADLNAYVKTAVENARMRWERALASQDKSPAWVAVATLTAALTAVAMSWRSAALTKTLKYILSIVAASVAFFVLVCAR